MNPEDLRTLLNLVRQGQTGVDDAMVQLRDLPYRALGFANADTHRHLRTGFPEVVYGPGKTPPQIAALLKELGARTTVMASRITPDVAAAVQSLVPEARYLEVARLLVLGADPPRDKGRGRIAVLTAGTADIPVAEEAAVTCELDGNDVVRVFDVGVAGLHRLLAHKDTLQACEVLVAVAGMDAVLPTVTAGLFGRPVIGVPTSVGYGASFGGVAGMLTMLNSCATGVAVVNIDNGFGAGRMASMLNRKRPAT